MTSLMGSRLDRAPGANNVHIHMHIHRDLFLSSILSFLGSNRPLNGVEKKMGWVELDPTRYFEFMSWILFCVVRPL